VTICNYKWLYTVIAALIATYNTYSHIALIGTPAFIEGEPKEMLRREPEGGGQKYEND
jgi:hypothetical protein